MSSSFQVGLDGIADPRDTVVTYPCGMYIKGCIEQVYTEYSARYDSIQSEWDYDRDVSFVTDLLDESDPGECRLLDVGCGTGEHTRRFVEAGFDVTAIDPNEGMVDRAREKVDATFQVTGLPGTLVTDAFDVIVAIRGVINHLPREDLDRAIADVVAHLAADGVFVFDNSPLPSDGNHPGLKVGAVEDGNYGRIVQMNPGEDGRLHWDQIVVTPDRKVLVDTRPLTPFDDIEIAAALSDHGLVFEPVDGFGPTDSRTVFVCTPDP